MDDRAIDLFGQKIIYHMRCNGRGARCLEREDETGRPNRSLVRWARITLASLAKASQQLIAGVSKV
jgi:hypothetical protein